MSSRLVATIAARVRYFGRCGRFPPSRHVGNSLVGQFTCRQSTSVPRGLVAVAAGLEKKVAGSTGSGGAPSGSKTSAGTAPTNVRIEPPTATAKAAWPVRTPDSGGRQRADAVNGAHERTPARLRGDGSVRVALKPSWYGSKTSLPTAPPETACHIKARLMHGS